MDLGESLSNTISLPKEHSNKMILKSYCYTHKSVPGQTHIRVFFSVYGNQHKDPRLNNAQRVRDFVIFNLKWDIFLKLLPQGSETYIEEEVERLKESEGMWTPKKQCLPDIAGLVHV